MAACKWMPRPNELLMPTRSWVYGDRDAHSTLLFLGEMGDANKKKELSRGVNKISNRPILAFFFVFCCNTTARGTLVAAGQFPNPTTGPIYF